MFHRPSGNKKSVFSSMYLRYWNTHKTVNLSQDTFLGFLNILFATSDFDLGFLRRTLLLFTISFPIFLIVDIDLDTKLVPELVNSGTLSTNDATNIFAVNLKVNGL